jgi:hypothetical protein
MGKGELDVGGKELFDVRTTDIICLFDLDHTEDLWGKKKFKVYTSGSFFFFGKTYVD